MGLLLSGPANALAQATAGTFDPPARINNPITAAAAYVDERMVGAMWKRQSLADGSVTYQHPMAEDVCTLIVTPPLLKTSSDTDIGQIRKEAEQHFGGRALGENKIYLMNDGSTIVSTSIANGRDQAADLYIVLKPEQRAAVPYVAPQRQHVQLFVYRQVRQSICRADIIVERVMRSVGGGVVANNGAATITRDATSGADTAAPVGSTNVGSTNMDPLEAARGAKEAFLSLARRSGDPMSIRSQLTPTVNALQTLVGISIGDRRVEALLELGIVQRLQFDFEKAVPVLASAAEIAEARSMRDVAFKAWIEVVRAASSLKRYGIASAAFERATDAAGDTPSQQQRFELADKGSLLLERRGEGEAALSRLPNVLRQLPGPEFAVRHA